jgi:hypothetical protein
MFYVIYSEYIMKIAYLNLKIILNFLEKLSNKNKDTLILKF